MLGLVVLALTGTLLPRQSSLVGALIVLALFTAALDLGSTAFGALMTELDPAGRGTLMSLVGLAIAVGTGIVPPLMRPLWESGGYTAVTFVLGALGLGTAVIIGLFVAERPVSMPPLPEPPETQASHPT